MGRSQTVTDAVIAEGLVKHYKDVDPETHAAEVLADIKALAARQAG